MEKESDLIRVFAGSEVEVIFLQGELEKIGISSIIKNDFQSGITAGFMGGIPSGIDLFIQESDLEKAEPIIKGIMQNTR